MKRIAASGWVAGSSTCCSMLGMSRQIRKPFGSVTRSSESPLGRQHLRDAVLHLTGQRVAFELDEQVRALRQAAGGRGPVAPRRPAVRRRHRLGRGPVQGAVRGGVDERERDDRDQRGTRRPRPMTSGATSSPTLAVELRQPAPADRLLDHVVADERDAQGEPAPHHEQRQTDQARVARGDPQRDRPVPQVDAVGDEARGRPAAGARARGPAGSAPAGPRRPARSPSSRRRGRSPRRRARSSWW